MLEDTLTDKLKELRSDVLVLKSGLLDTQRRLAKIESLPARLESLLPRVSELEKLPARIGAVEAWRPRLDMLWVRCAFVSYD